MNDDPTEGRRDRTDRRRRPTSPLDALRPGGRRAWPRREEERRGEFFVDRYDAVTLALVVALLGLTIADGLLTIELLGLNGVEANPLMRYLLARGHFVFLSCKFVLTAFGIPFLVLFKHYPFFGTRFRVGWFLAVFVGLYLVLLSYQWDLLQTRQSGLSAAGLDSTLRVTLPSGGTAGPDFLDDPDESSTMTAAHHALLAAWFGILGCCVGSFLNVCVYRLPRGMSLFHPRSQCPHCRRAIRARDNLPVVGWLLLRGRCRDCRGAISPRYAAVELTAGLLFTGAYLAAVGLWAGDPWEQAGAGTVLAFLLACWVGIGLVLVVAGIGADARRGLSAPAGPASHPGEAAGVGPEPGGWSPGADRDSAR
jgi:leader peptidase (prepilin peptidase)/N-methyltransferase